MNVGLPSETIKAAAVRIKELERENAALRKENTALKNSAGQCWFHLVQGEYDLAEDHINNAMEWIEADFEAEMKTIEEEEKS